MAEVCQLPSSRYRYLETFFESGPDLFMADPVAPPTEKERSIDKALAKLEEGIQEVFQSDKYREYLKTLGKFHDYSLGNLILIWFQNPEATRVAGFNTWKELDRNVKKGEKGLMILAPCFAPKGPRAKKEPEPEEEEEGEEKPSVRIVRNPIYFKVVYVFDVSQTEGLPLPAVEVPVVQGEDSKPLFDLGLQYCVKNGIRILDKPTAPVSPDTMGYYSPREREIWVRSNVPQNQQTKSLFHEIAHSRAADKFGAGAEVLAESVAFAVCNHFGFDTGGRSFPYVALWAQDVKLLKQNLDRIRDVTKAIIEEVTVLAKMQDPELKDWSTIGTGILTGVAAGIAQHYAMKHLTGSNKGKLEEWHTEGLACKICGRPVPPGAIPEVWAEQHLTQNHPKYIQHISVMKLPWVAGLYVVGDDYPLRKNALKKLMPYIILDVHDDGDLTVHHNGKEWIVSTEGKAYINHKLGDVAILGMMLLTKEIRERLPKLRATEFQEDPIVQVKFFTPWTHWTWYATEFDGEDEFFGLVQGDYNEMGYFSLKELESVRGPYGLKIERDRHFNPTPLSQVREKVEAGKVADIISGLMKDSEDFDQEEFIEEYLGPVMRENVGFKMDLDDIKKELKKWYKITVSDKDLKSALQELIEAGEVLHFEKKGNKPESWQALESWTDSRPVPLGKEVPKLIEVYKTTIVKHYRAKGAFHKKSFRVMKPNKNTLIWLGCLKSDQWTGNVCSDNQALHKTIVKKTAAGMREVEKLKNSGIPVKYFAEEGIVPRAKDDIMTEIETALDKSQPVG
jgi:hypothetical protein